MRPFGVEHDVIEKILGSMQTILGQCVQSNQLPEDPELGKKVSFLLSHYKKLDEAEPINDGCGPHDRYMLKILNLIEAVSKLFAEKRHDISILSHLFLLSLPM